jgi:CRISPR-associated protein Csb2
MLTISAELLHGTIRATGFEDTAITGDSGEGEWPPSPARLFAAFVAADGTARRQHVTGGRELKLLEGAGPPRILASPSSDVLRSSLRNRYVVVDRLHQDSKTRETGAVQEYVGRASTEVRPGTRLAPAHSTIAYTWDDLDADDEMLRALSLRAARIGYLGCGDSPVSISVSRAPAQGDDWWVPDQDGITVLPVPYEGLIENLDEAFERFLSGEGVRRAWVPNRYARYRPPGEEECGATEPIALWVRFAQRVNGRRLLAVTEALRLAVLEHYTREVAGGPEGVPSVLSGHGFQGSGYQHAHFVALPEVGFRHARGYLHGAAVVLPPRTPPVVVEGVRSCLWRVQVLARPGVFETRVRPYAGEPRPLAAVPSRWLGPSRRWVSATPVVHERFRRRGSSPEEVARWCHHAGVAASLLSCRVSSVPIGEGALSLSPSEVHREGKECRPYSHLEVAFDRPVAGPLILGGARQFGFGLMYPSDVKERGDA